jgi:hypothetical protein
MFNREEDRMKLSVSLCAMFFLTCFFSIQTSYGQCSRDVDCKGDRICVNGECVEPEKSSESKPSGSEQSVMKAATAGWARGAAITGYVCAPIILGLGLSSAITTGGDASLALGISAFSVGVIALPIIAVGGASARSGSNVRGSMGLRIPGYITYGLALANGGVLVALGIADAKISAVPIITCSALGAIGCVLMATDALISSGQAKRTSVSADDDPGYLRLSIVPKSRGMGMRLEYLF